MRVCASLAALGFGPLLAQSGEFPPVTEHIYATGAEPASDALRANMRPTPLTRAFLPELVDLASRFAKVGDQGNLPSCTAWAIGYAARSYYETVGTARVPDRSSIPSPAYIYAALEPDCDDDTSNYEALELLKEGAVSLADMPYSDRTCPVIDAALRRRVRDAGKFNIESFRYIVASGSSATPDKVDAPIDERNFPDLLKAELAKGNPVVIAIQADAAFMRLKGRNVWTRSAPASRREAGWHAITLVGYNERGQYFKFINSWGTDWGDKGFGRLSYQTLIDHDEPGYVMTVAGVDPAPPAPDPDLDPVPSPAPAPALVLPQVSCGKLRVETVGGAPRVSGFVGTREDMDKVVAASLSEGQPHEVVLRPWPQCETLMTLDEPLAEQDLPQISLPKPEYGVGETLDFSVTMAGFEGFLHVAYIQADGNVVHLVQQSVAALRTQSRGSIHRFGDGKDGRAHFEVTGPFGDEMIVAIASASPLFDRPRPQVELEREFLTALRAAILARPDPDLPARRITAAYERLTTREN